MGSLFAALVRAVYVRDLPNGQFQRHQLRAEIRARRGSGRILFFTCLSAVLAPLAMGVVSDAMGGPGYGFALATVFAGLLFVGLLLNRIFVSHQRREFERADETEYNHACQQQEPRESAEGSLFMWESSSAARPLGRASARLIELPGGRARVGGPAPHHGNHEPP